MPNTAAAAPLVTLGWVVKRRYRKTPNGRHFDKVISTIFSSQSTAETFRRFAEQNHQQRAPEPEPTELDVEFFVTNEIGVDGLPAGL